ncbi:MAG: cell division control protein 14 [Trizodia sp. TS-e1964]|nr:MAG: cell division control protein 14 [Trizodia sp. TS-e1964]
MPNHHGTSYGQVIEYIADRLYLASYTHAPTSATPFPYPKRPAKSPSKRSAKSSQGSKPAELPEPFAGPPVYFSIDKSLLYNAFHHDFGPLHIGHLYRFAVHLHDILGDPENKDRPVVFWSNADAKSRANAACILACYMVLIQSWPPHLALAPISQADPPFMPFRDAGYSQADYGITVQDVVYGVWKAKEQELCGLSEFSLEEYEKFERVDMGDFNWLTPSFLAFASPQSASTDTIPVSSPQFKALPSTAEEVNASDIPGAFKNILCHFKARDVGLVVRLNSILYSPSYFTAMGINHVDMIFDDGTCPPLPLVRKFITLAHETINVHKKGIAVHCKAGLGRTGCLIGAYLIYRHGFTANEIISFMRFMRPGMVVGPQQHWLHLNQGSFREWWYEDAFKAKLANLSVPITPTKSSQQLKSSRLGAGNSQTATPPNGSQSRRSPLGEVSQNEGNVKAEYDENLPAPTPGQPRKASRHHPYARNVSSSLREEEAQNDCSSTEVVSIHRQSRGESESEEEWQLRMLARRTVSRSPKEKRSVSYMTTTTTIYSSQSHMETSSGSDVENRVCTPPHRPKTPGSMKSGNGAGVLGISKVRSSPRRSVTEKIGIVKTEGGNGVRKSSGRVGSVGSALSNGALIRKG